MAAATSYAPGVDAAKKALGASIPITARPHPTGEAGVRLSLDEVASRIRRGKDDPMIVAWARRAIHENGSPQDTKGRAQAILTQLRKEVSYVPDPVGTEFMAQPRHILCLDARGLCFKGADCDEMVITYGSACLAVGIPTKIIGEAFNGRKIPEHVLAAIKDEFTGDWLRVDPSTPKPVGEYVAGSNEVWIDPLDVNGAKNAVLDGGASKGGFFVGVGGVPTDTPAGAAVAIPPMAIGGVNDNDAGRIGEVQAALLKAYALGATGAATAPSSSVGWWVAGAAVVALGAWWKLSTSTPVHARAVARGRRRGRR